MKIKMELSLFLICFILLSSCQVSHPSSNYEYIIADHTIVDDYDKIPDEYLNIVKSWLVAAEGESHSAAYRDGMYDLMVLDNKYGVTIFSGSYPSTPIDTLRIGRYSSIGEGSFWTNSTAITNVSSRMLSYSNSGNPVHVIFLAWCWDFTRNNDNGTGATGERDSVYGCHWYGSTVGGPDGDHNWGLDSTDQIITGNSVSLQTYLDAIDTYNDFFEQNGLVTKAIFSTGPVDGDSADGEKGYQRYIKHEKIREYVLGGEGRILFDYADILSYSNSGALQTSSWTNPDSGVEYVFPLIHVNNDAEDTGHISTEGSIRLAKAMWWLLARMAGWDGN